MLTKEMIGVLNVIAIDDFSTAKKVLEYINILTNSQYDWLNKRVIFFDNPNESTSEKYKHAHDAYVWAQE